jgi:hypothetical protein
MARPQCLSHTPFLTESFSSFARFFVPLRSVVAVYRFGTGPHTLCSPARLLALLAPCKFVSPSSPRRSLVSHSRSLQRDSNVFFSIWFSICALIIAGFRDPGSCFLGTVRGCKPRFLVFGVLGVGRKFSATYLL